MLGRAEACTGGAAGRDDLKGAVGGDGDALGFGQPEKRIRERAV